jgi:uncharacterized membrane protein (UPF0127 family)
LILILFCIGVVTGCGRAVSPPTVEMERRAEVVAAEIQAQPKLPTLRLWIGAQELVTEIARTPAEQERGMMLRKQMGENEGMLFIFPEAKRAAFWMKNTTVPLTAAYIGSDGVVLELHDLKPLDETPAQASTDKVRYVLEVPQGWFARHKLGVGAMIRTERGSLGGTFFGTR